MKNNLLSRKSNSLLFWILALFFVTSTQVSWGQTVSKQVLGQNPSYDGGFEGQAPTALANSSTAFPASGTYGSATDNFWGKSGGTASIKTDANARSGNKYANFQLGSTSHQTIRTPYSGTNASSIVVQFYYKGDKNSITGSGARGGNFATTNVYGSYTSTNTSSWTLYQAVISLAATTATSYGAVSIKSGSTSTASYDIDDFVVYDASAIDASAPNQPGAVTASIVSSSSYNVSWGAPTGGVDGGGYVVVRYASAPNSDNDPNQNGIYALNNTITNGTGSLQGTVAYIGTLTSFTDTGLTPGTVYYYKVYAVDKAFNYSAENTGQTPAIPTITGSGSLSAFTTTYGTASAAQSFSVSATNLIGNLYVNAPLGYEISSTSATSGFTSGQITLNPTSQSVSNTTIWIRLKATAAAGSYDSLNVQLTSTAASTVNITTTSSGNIVSPANLTITAGDRSKTYGTTLTLGTSSFTSSGLANSETIGSITLTSSGAAATTAVGTYSIVPSAATGGTFTASNYSITYTNGSLTVGTAALTITANNQSKNYGTSLTLGTTAFSTIGLANSETIGGVTLTCSQAADTAAAVGTYAIVPSAATGGTFTASNYVVSYSNGTLTVSTTTPSAPIITGVTGGDHSLTVDFTAPSIDGGATITNYQYSTNGTTYTAVSPAQTASPIVITGLTNGTSYPVTLLAVNSVGNGTPSTSLSGTPVSPYSPAINVTGLLSAMNTTYGTPSSTSTFTVVGSNLNDDIVITAPTGFEISQTSASSGFATTQILTQSSGTVASTTIYVRLSATAVVANSPYSGNITLTSTGATTKTVATVSSAVSKAPLTISGLAATDKVYDQTTTVSVTGTPSYSGLVNGESFSISDSVTYAFATATAGVAKPITRTGNYSIPSTNYSLTQPNLTATITPITVTLSAAATSNKVYDGTTAATVTGTLNGVLSGDTVSYSGTGTFASASIGTAIVVTPSTNLSGAQAANYSLTQPATLSADITAKALTISGITISNKVYNGNTTAIISGTPTLIGVVGSENVTLDATGAAASFGDKNIGNTKAVTVGGYALSGTAISNYTLTQPSGLTANITAAPLTITGISISNKQYDGTTAATITGTPVLNGVVGSENVTLVTSGATAVFTSSAIASGVAVTVSGYSITGSDASNYSLTQPSLTANITAVTKYYFVPTASPSLTDTAQWWSNSTGGTGSHPADFITATNITYQINVNATTTAAWTVSGTGSKIVVGDGTNTPNLTIASGFAITGTIDVNAGATLTCGAATLPTFGTLANTSTVNISASCTLAVPSTTLNIGNLIVSNGAVFSITSSSSGRQLNINGDYDVSAGVFSAIGSGSTFVLNFAGVSKIIKSSSLSDYNKLGSTIIAAGASYTLSSNLIYTNTTARTFVLNGSLDISNYTLDFSLNTFTMGAGGVLTQNATSTIKTSNVSATPLPSGATWNGTVEYYSTSAQPVVAGNYNNLTITGASVKTPETGTISVAKNLTINSGATFDGSVNNPVLNVGGNFTNSGTFTQGTGTFTFNGTTSQTITNAGSFNNVTVNNAAGLIAGSNITVGGILTLTSGVITTNANSVIVNGSVSRTSGHIAGNLTKTVATTTTNSTYEIGGATIYRPITFNFASITTGGTLTASVSQTAGPHPNLSSSAISPSKRLDRYYKVNSSGLVFTTCDATFNFDASDVLNGANTSNFLINRYASSAWNSVTTGTLNSTSSQATGLTAFGDFAIGELNTDPVLGAAPTSLSFANQCINTTSNGSTFALSGQYLTSDPINISSLSGFTYSLDDATYTSTLSISHAAGSLSATTVYIKFSPTSVSSYAGSISISGGGISSPITVSVTSATGVNTPATTITGATSSVTALTSTLAGSFSAGCSPIANYGLEFSTSSTFTNGTGTQVAGTGGASFTASLSGLNPNTTYYYKSYVTDGTGTIYGTQSSFTTLGIDVPVATPATNIASTSFNANWGAVTGASNYLLNVYLPENVAGWSIPTGATASLTADTANPNNTNAALALSSGTVSYVTGVTTSAASGTLWTTSKYWEIGVNTTGIYKLTLSSAQQSSASGPRDFKIQYKIGINGTYVDVLNSTISVSSFASSTITDLPLPKECENQSSLYIRWIPTSTVSSSGGTVGTGGTSRIDDILIKGKKPISGYSDLSVSGTNSSVTGLNIATTYYYDVKAHNSSATSTNSNLITVTTTQLPTTLNGVSLANASVCANTNNTVNLTGLLTNSISTVSYTINNGSTQTATSVSSDASGNASFSLTLPYSYNGQVLKITQIERTDLTSPITQFTSNNTVTLSVNSLSVAGTASATSANVCSGSGTTVSLTGNTGTIQWQQSANGTSGWTDISGAASASLNTGNLTATTYYQAVVTSGVCSSITSNLITVTVNATPVAGTAAGSTSICSGNSATVTLSGNTGTIQWQQSANGTSGWTDISGATSASLNTGNLTATTYYQAVVTSGVCSSITSNMITITVNPLPTATIAGTATVCQNATNPDVTFTGANGTAPYTFTYTIGSGSNQTVATTSGNSITVSAPTTASGTFVYTLVGVQDSSSTTCSQAQTGSATITVNATSVAGTAAGSTTICSGSGATVTLSGNTGTIQWQQSANGTSGWTNISGATAASYTTANLTATTYYQAVVTSGVCPSATSNMITITVNPTSAAVMLSTNTAICTGSGITLSIGGVTGTIQWQQSADGSTNWTDISGVTSATYATGNLTATTYYHAVVTSGVCPAFTTSSVRVQVNANVTYYADADHDGYGNAAISQVSCMGAPAGYVANSTDCDDTRANTHPGAVDLCNDGIDNDCNGVIDNVGQPGGCAPVVSYVIPSQCGTTLSLIDNQVYAALIANAQGYRWKVTKMISGTPSTIPADIQMIDTSLRTLKLTQLTSYAFDTTYQIEIAVKINNNWQPYYGAACTITTPATTTTIVSTQCGTQLGLMTDVVYANLVSYAAGYRFKVTNLTTNAIQTIDRSLREFRFNLLSNIPYNTLFKVEVAVKNTDGTYLPYGPSCNVTTPLFPTTSLQDSQCDYVAASNNELVYAKLVANATNYRFNFTNTALSYGYTFDTVLRMFALNTVPGLTPNTTYSVKVAVKIGGVWGPYNKVCTLTTPGTVKPTTAITGADTNFNATAYPNPFAENFKLTVTTTSAEVLQVKVYDMLGKLIDNSVMDPMEVRAFEVGNNYPSGVYNVIVSQGDNIKTLRVIKR